jgi:hypothetical protein
VAWLGLTVYVLAADEALVLTGHHTMSTAARAALRHPKRRPYVVAAWLLLSAHLCRADRFGHLDPITLVGSLFGRLPVGARR